MLCSSYSQESLGSALFFSLSSSLDSLFPSSVLSYLMLILLWLFTYAWVILFYMYGYHRAKREHWTHVSCCCLILHLHETAAHWMSQLFNTQLLVLYTVFNVQCAWIWMICNLPLNLRQTNGTIGSNEQWPVLMLIHLDVYFHLLIDNANFHVCFSLFFLKWFVNDDEAVSALDPCILSCVEQFTAFHFI